MLIAPGARRVAEAILEMARDRQDFDVWLRDLRALNAMVSAPETLYMLDHPDVPFEQKRQAIDHVGGSVRPESLHVLYYLVERHRAHQLGAVLQQLEGLVNTERNVRVADVTTAQPLAPDQEAELSRGLSDRFGGTVTLAKHIDPSIVGGVIVKVGDLLLDGSVNGRLRGLREQLIRTVR